jgi:hypothetical protein
MIPGSTTKLTESVVAVNTVINPKTDVIIVTGGAGTIQTITPNFGGGVASGILFLIPQSAHILGTSGNIAVGLTLTINRVTTLVYSKISNKWYIGL